ncbi:S8/S53 family peptidase [Actinospica durhamensis]|uniref:S8/S53 family peptidase n=1 Tax=Actinospica durhamensis TaxID=1508375 RepID=A0A941IPE8_9ACTN|nr:S53 family peptidase [Actinospica durhamensis]MBR7836460.1 S8/S53 family peptidase [Actinospica durhamensis]
MLAAPLPILALAVPANAATPALSGRVVLSGEAVPGLAKATHTGSLAASQNLSLEVSLAPRNQAKLAAFIRAVSDPKSSLYKHYLTVAQYAAEYGATDAQVQQVTSYLHSQGLSVGKVTANHLTLAVSGSTAQVEKAFDVSIGTYKTGSHSFYANAAAPSLPSSIASVVAGVAGLSTSSVRTAAYTVTSHATTAKATTALTPTIARDAYNLASSISSGYNGSGETVGLVEFSSYSASAVAAYNTKYSLGATAATVVKVDGGTTDSSGAVEDELDIEVEYALAPKATVKAYEAPNSDAGEVALYAALASADVPVISSSWGEPETEEDNLTSDNTDFTEMAAQGQSIYSASGDDGADDNGSSLSVDYPASDPYVSGVGGTQLSVTSSYAWSAETAWSDSGGGKSVEYATPSFQTSVNSTGDREVPDVSAAGGNNSPWYIDGGSWEDVWGTSAAAPNWAAFTADYDTAAAALGKSKFGYANSFIYTVAESSYYSSAFHDVTSGNNGGYSAGTGYDPVSGWGSYNGGNFIADEL